MSHDDGNVLEVGLGMPMRSILVTIRRPWRGLLRRL